MGRLVVPVLSRQQGAGGSPLLAGLRSYWKMDEGAGTRADSVVATGNDLTASNNPLNAAGKIGNAAQFVAASIQGLYRNSALFTGGSFSIEAWVWFDSLITQNIFIQGVAAGAANIGFYLLTTDAKIHFSVNAFATEALSTTVCVISTWYHVVCTYDGTNMRVYVNGALQATVAATATYTADRFVFGVGQQLAASPMNGRVDGPGAWTRALALSDVVLSYNGGAGRDWPFP